MSYEKSLETFRTIDLDDMRPSGFLARMHELIAEKIAKVESKHGFKEVTKCPVCDSTERQREYEARPGIWVARCATCTLRYTDRIPVNVEDVYSDEGYLPVATERYMSNVAYRKERFGKERIAIIREMLGDAPGKSVLDVGCGTGWFLETAREQGFEITGQELGKGLAAWTAERLGATVHTCLLGEIPADAGRFDVITMFDLLEHVESPVQLVADCRRLLNPGGIILIFTPNFDSLAMTVMGKDSNLVVPTDHLTYFTRASVDALAKRTGFDLAWYRTCGIDLGDLKGWYDWKGDAVTAAAMAKMYDAIQPVVDAAGAGNHMRFVFRAAG